MSRYVPIALLTALAITQGARAQAPAPTSPPRVDAREQAPPALLGAWKLAPGESHFADGRGPRMQYRLFSYGPDGRLLVDYWTASASGAISSGNWTSAFDGSWQPEYTRGYGATPYAMVILTKRDERTFDLKAARQGKVFETGQFVLSPDGQTLTFTFEAGGATTKAVYHPWNLIN